LAFIQAAVLVLDAGTGRYRYPGRQSLDRHSNRGRKRAAIDLLSREGAETATIGQVRRDAPSLRQLHSEKINKVWVFDNDRKKAEDLRDNGGRGPIPLEITSTDIEKNRSKRRISFVQPPSWNPCSQTTF
jgi:hypothetical protein